MTRALFVAGAGGVGKTTLSAAIAAHAAGRGLSTLVMTVDPARRLADALGLEAISNEPTKVPGSLPLHAAMLDAATAWESIVKRHADPEVVDRLLASPFFQAVAHRFPAGQAYAAGEETAGHIERGVWDLVVVDTPPAGGGIDFFSAPERISSLVGGRVLRWLTGAKLPGRRTLYAFTARPVLKVADSVLGGPLLEDVAEFLLDLRTAYDGISRRARDVERHFRSNPIAVVTTADPTPVAETVRFFRELPKAASTPRAIIFNRSLPAGWSRRVRPPAGTPAAVVGNLTRWGGEARRQADVRQELASRYGAGVIEVPWTSEPLTSLEGLVELWSTASGPIERLV